jgi:hypothetical protein
MAPLTMASALVLFVCMQTFEEDLVKNLVQMSNAECSTVVDCREKAKENYVNNQFFAAIPYFALALEKQPGSAGACSNHNNLGISFLQQRYVDEGVRHLELAKGGDNGTNALCISAATHNLDRMDQNLQESSWLTVGVQPAAELAARRRIADGLFFQGGAVATALIHYKSVLQEEYDPITHVKCLWMQQRVADWEDMEDSLRTLSQHIDQLVHQADSSASETLAELCGYLSATLAVPITLAHDACKARSAVLEREAARSNTETAVAVPTRSGVLRLGYFSQSFCNHPVGQQMVQLMPFHRSIHAADRKRGPLVNVTCYSLVNCNPATDKWTARMMDGCHQYVELGDLYGVGTTPSLSAARAARRISHDAMEVLVDINGYKTSAAAMAVLAQLKALTCRGPAEGQAGGKGTTAGGSGCVVTAHMLETTNLYASGMGFGAPFIDFFITDSRLSPADLELPGRPGGQLSKSAGKVNTPRRYEGLMLLPHLFWAPQAIATMSNHTHGGSSISSDGTNGGERKALLLHKYGLPSSATFVLGSFNRLEKVTRSAFHAWCRILLRLPGSILWLFAGGDDVRAALKAEAAALGVLPSRLVFAAFVDAAEHRHRLQALVDVSLDTPGYNGGTTTADLLRAAVPVITLTSSLAGATTSGAVDANHGKKGGSAAGGERVMGWRGRGAQGLPYYSRMASSVLSSANLELLVCHSLKEYVEQAVSAGSRPRRWRRLAAVMAARLQGDITHTKAEAGGGTPLFDHSAQVSSMVRAFQSAVEHGRSGGGGGHVVATCSPH